MAYQHREGQGSIFPNEKKSDKQPDWRGDALFDGQEIEIAGWTKQGKHGEFISLSIKLKGQRGNGGPGPIRPHMPKMQQSSSANLVDDEIPF